MSLVALECPACGAPLEVARGTCPYCGATIERAGATYDRVEHAIVSLGTVGPSNRKRVEATLIRLGVAEETAARAVASAPVEIDLGPPDKAPWKEAAVELFEAGASAKVERRMVDVVIEPPQTVWLEAVGPHLAKVVFALREYVELDMQAARDLLHSVPCVLGPPLPAERAQQFLVALVAAGATARLE